MQSDNVSLQNQLLIIYNVARKCPKQTAFELKQLTCLQPLLNCSSLHIRVISKSIVAFLADYMDISDLATISLTCDEVKYFADGFADFINSRYISTDIYNPQFSVEKLLFSFETTKKKACLATKVAVGFQCPFSTELTWWKDHCRKSSGEHKHGTSSCSSYSLLRKRTLHIEENVCIQHWICRICKEYTVDTWIWKCWRWGPCISYQSPHTRLLFHSIYIPFFLLLGAPTLPLLATNLASVKKPFQCVTMY